MVDRKSGTESQCPRIKWNNENALTLNLLSSHETFKVQILSLVLFEGKMIENLSSLLYINVQLQVGTLTISAASFCPPRGEGG